jgi:hypothetical protein
MVINSIAARKRLPLLLCFLFFGGMALGAQLSPARQAFYAEYHRILFAIVGQHKFSAKDRKVIVEEAMSKDIATEGLALTLLSAAVSNKVFGWNELSTILLKKFQTANAVKSRLYLSTARNALELGIGMPSSATEVYSKATFSVLPKEERSYIAAQMAYRDNSHMTNAATIIITRPKLDPDSFRWVSGQLDREVKSTTGNQKLYWTFIKQAVLQRNASK